MFNRDDKSSKETETIVGASVTVRGNFEGKGNIIIDGMLEGSLYTEGSLLAGEKSIIKASIKAKEAKILGQVQGQITLSGLLELGPQAIINGDIEIGDITIAKGAIINGKISMKNGKTRSETLTETQEA